MVETKQSNQHSANEEHEGKVVYSFKIGEQKVELVEPKHSTPAFFNDTVSIAGKRLELDIWGSKIPITETIFNTWIIMGVFVLLIVFIRLKTRNLTQIPRGIQNLIEMIVETFEKFTKTIMGEKNKGFAGFYMSLFFFILACNWSGLFALRNPTADIATTLALSMTTVGMMHGFAIYAKGIKGYLKDYIKPYWVMLPINIIEKLIPGLSLALRLFGNIVAGAIILSLTYSLILWLIDIVILFPVGWLAGVVIGGAQTLILIPLHLFLDIFVGILQSFIFVVLSMTFVAREMNEEEEETHQEAHVKA